MLPLSPILVLLASAPAGAGVVDSCYHYAPTVVSLTGRLMQRTMPGPPHYDSFRRGDRPEVVDFLILDAPICTIPDYKDSPNTDAFQRQDTLQVRKQDATWREVRRLTGQRVTVTGTLVEWALGRDRTPVVLDPTAVRPAR
ncbi:MAG TPA: DUF4431 domain-containing protein [Gemmatimonadales bacterium]|jgi:hypothetical protein|nr:DUF4431 domain-containing protein [Gemmatimonadales bacterium]